MYTLYDPALTVRYTQDEDIIIYDNDVIIVESKFPGLMTVEELLTTAKKILESIQPQNEYYSTQEVAETLKMTRQSVYNLINDKLIAGIHYINIGDYRYITNRGYELLKIKYQKRLEL